MKTEVLEENQKSETSKLISVVQTRSFYLRCILSELCPKFGFHFSLQFLTYKFEINGGTIKKSKNCQLRLYQRQKELIVEHWREVGGLE
jgi:hypothetical protein